MYLPSTYETFICSIMNTLNETIATFGVAELWKLSPQRKRDFEEIFNLWNGRRRDKWINERDEREREREKERERED